MQLVWVADSCWAEGYIQLSDQGVVRLMQLMQSHQGWKLWEPDFEVDMRL